MSDICAIMFTALQLLQASLEWHTETCEFRGDTWRHRPDRPPHQPSGVLLWLQKCRGLRGGFWLPGRVLHPLRWLQQAGMFASTCMCLHILQYFALMSFFAECRYSLPFFFFLTSHRIFLSASVCLWEQRRNNPQRHRTRRKLYWHHSSSEEGSSDLWGFRDRQVGEIQLGREHHLSGRVCGAEDHPSTLGQSFCISRCCRVIKVGCKDTPGLTYQMLLLLLENVQHATIYFRC